MKARVTKWGNSLAVRIPKAVAKSAHLKEGDAVELVPGEDGRLEIRRTSRLPTLAELVARITPENRHGEISLEKSIGNETSEW